MLVVQTPLQVLNVLDPLCTQEINYFILPDRWMSQTSNKAVHRRMWPHHVAKYMPSTSGIFHWHKYNKDYSVFQFISGCRFSSGTTFSLCVAQSVSVRHVSASDVSVLQLQLFGTRKKPTNLVCSAYADHCNSSCSNTELIDIVL